MDLRRLYRSAINEIRCFYNILFLGFTVKRIFRKEMKSRCYNLTVTKEMANDYGINRSDLLAGFIALYIEKGKEDTLKELNTNT